MERVALTDAGGEITLESRVESRVAPDVLSCARGISLRKFALLMSFVPLAVATGCGARTLLDLSEPADVVEGGPPDAGQEADAGQDADAGEDAPDVNDVPVPLEGDVPPEAIAPCTLNSCGARSVCVGGRCVPAARVFVSSATYPGNLGGVRGADATCQALAVASGLGGSWMAWISDDTTSPSIRFTRSTAPYALVDGTVVASSWSALTSGRLGHGVDHDENDRRVGGVTTEAWTATNTDGTSNGGGCKEFTSSSHYAPYVVVGVSGNTDATWTNVYLQFCDRTDHLYCFEQ
jgi:hypothetical protein